MSLWELWPRTLPPQTWQGRSPWAREFRKPFRHIDSVGAGAIVKAMEDLEREYGVRFKRAALLMDMANKGNRFYA